MDKLDARLMKELQSPASFQWAPRIANHAIALKLGVDRSTVRRRLARLSGAGFLKGFEIIVNPRLIGREISSLELQAEEATEEMISRIRLLDGVALIFVFHGGRLRILIAHQSSRELENRTRLIASICGGERLDVWKFEFPPCPLNLTITDWEIIGVMLADPRKKIKEIAQKVKVSTRTVKRRLDHLTTGNAFFLQPLLDLENAPRLGCNLLIFCPDPKLKASADKQIVSKFDEIVFTYTSAREHSIFTILCHNLSDAEGISGWIRELDGVERVTMGIPKKMIVVRNWVEEEIWKRTSKSSAAKFPMRTK